MSDKGVDCTENKTDISEAKGSEKKDQATEMNTLERTENSKCEKKSMDKKVPESIERLTETEKETVNSNLRYEKKSNIFQILIGLGQLAASIATVLTAALAFGTLKEMQTDRNNAYRPEIVAAPDIFEGGDIIEGEDMSDRKIMYINQTTRLPDLFYLEDPSDITDSIYLEIPYLTLKNIGQGTAKDIQISFSKEWMEEVVEVLNRYSGYDGVYTLNSSTDGGIEYFNLNYSGLDGADELYLSNSEKLINKITYIPADKTAVIVPIPDDWKKMLAVLYGQVIYSEKQSIWGTDLFMHEFSLPDAVISITCSDMQGVIIEKELVIPWTGRYGYQTRSDATGISLHLKTGFYEDYIE